eukprot:5587492-Pyramimonas_sp.AAC.1
MSVPRTCAGAVCFAARRSNTLLSGPTSLAPAPRCTCQGDATLSRCRAPHIRGHAHVYYGSTDA